MSRQTTDGARGRGGAWCELDALAVVNWCLQEFRPKLVVIGFDGRAGSQELAELSADACHMANVRCLLSAGLAPTPAISRYVRENRDVDLGLIFTASHNPPGYVGVKVRDQRGYAVVTAETPLDRVDLNVSPSADPVARIDALGEYARTVGERLRRSVSDFQGTIVVDAMHGAVGGLAESLPFVSWARARPLPFFGGVTPDPTQPENQAAARRFLNSQTAPCRALVASVDGDGDRLVLTTAKSGTIGSADLAGALISKGVVKRLITTVVAPRWIREQAQTAGVTVTVTDVGFRNVLDGWIGAGSRPALGLEPNGALVIVGKPDDYFERDSLEALAMILGEFRSVVELDEALAAVRDRHPLRQRQMTVQRNVREVIRKVDRALAREPRANWIRSRMGNFVRWEDGRQSCVVVRESGTEPVTRLYFELCDEEARQLVASLEP